MQTFVSKQFAIEAWEMQLAFVKTCYVNVNSRYSKNAQIKTNTFNMDKMLSLKTLKNT